MGRRRKDGNPLGLEPRVYAHHGQFIYRHRDGTAEQLGKDVARANARAKIYNDPDHRFGTLGYFLDLYIAEAEAGRLLRKKKPRTIADYKVHAPFLKSVFEQLLPTDLVRQPELLAEYRDRRKAKVRANRELSLLSAMYAWLIEKGYSPGLNVNPVGNVARNPEKPKERYVEDADAGAVAAIALRSVCMAMRLVYITLQRPADILALSPQSLTTKTVGGVAKRVLSVTQGKTGRTVNIELTDELEETLYMLSPDREPGKMKISESVTKLVKTFVHTSDGSRYSDDGMRAMLRRYCLKCGVSTFGLMDLRAKGATDMYLNGIPLERIQMLMGHKSVVTTEIYIKRLLALVRIAQPNRVKTGFA